MQPLSASDVRIQRRVTLKRICDVVAAAVGLVVLSPVFVTVALLIRVTSSGPVFFRQERIGMNFRPFRIYKFRTMIHNAQVKGSLLTSTGDPRITRVGRVLRQTKIDELPQLINVLLGDMSLVGPRPEVRKYVEIFENEYKTILSVRPGITDIASVKYRDESVILASSANPEQEYIVRILPDKLRLAEEYVRRSSLALDLALIFRTFMKLMPRQSTEDISPARHT